MAICNMAQISAELSKARRADSHEVTPMIVRIFVAQDYALLLEDMKPTQCCSAWHPCRKAGAAYRDVAIFMRSNEQVQQHVPSRLAEKFFPFGQHGSLPSSAIDLASKLDQDGIARLQLGDRPGKILSRIAFEIMGQCH